MRRNIFAMQIAALVTALSVAGCAGLTTSSGGGTKFVAPTITAQPANQIVTVGEAATFSVMATGTAPLTYRWLKNSASIAGATGASYTTPATLAGDSGEKFEVVVSNSAGSATSTIATLTVNAAAVAPSITTQPTNQTVSAGQSATFAVTATGTAPLSYQWQKNSANISGATSSSYTTPATTSGDNGAKFDVVVSNTAGNQASATAVLTINAAAVAPTITTQPANQTVTVGQTATFTVTATGTAPLSYQWQKNSANISGATASSYTTPATTSGDNGAKFDVVVRNSAGNQTSAMATLTVNAAAVAPTITTQPANQTVTVGQTATFTVIATGTAPLSYQWQKNSTNIAGATASSYTTPATTSADNGANFDVVVSNIAGNQTSAMATLAVNAVAVAPTITTQPANQTITAGQTATFTVTATGTAPLRYQWQKNTVNITGATSASYTTPVTTVADSGEQFSVTVSDPVGNTPSTTATLTVNPVTTSTINVVTYHYDNMRSGQNLNETILTTTNVNSTKFGKLGAFAVDGLVDAQPLYLSAVSIPSVGTKNVLYVATENDSVYAFDADSVNGNTTAFLWKVSVLGAGESPSDNRGCGQITPQIGITSTPVIDRTRGLHGAIYVVGMSKDANGNYYQRIHALDLTTGAELFGGPTTVQATYPGTGDNSSGGNVVFDPKQYKERPGLLEIGSTIYTTWSSHCDARPYTSWVISYSANTLAQVNVLNLVPNGSEGGIWMAGTAPAADSSGNIYFMVGNGDFDTTLNASGFPSQGDCGQCYVKLSSSAPMTLLDYFTPSNSVSESDSDTDFGSGGPLLLPDLVDANGNTRHLAVGSGKDAIIYVVDRDNMGKFNSTADNIYQQINGQIGGVWSKPSYFNNTVYYGAVGDHLKAFPITSALLALTPSSQSSASFAYPGTTPSISANGTTNGIVWAVEANSTGILHAYDATNLTNELYNSNQAANNRDQFSDNKYVTPMVANGKVYVGTPNSVVVFGLLP
ncbi:MAG: immunoglobulin domain-containing protein [Candidatus Acidiferrum sp.]